uniref:Myb/SANT-like DNA-binding domain-containing protein n=1 Tax=Eptatretus burgeri TaxID=7764 RepID=A0A8C4Q7K7_EPTBU
MGESTTGRGRTASNWAAFAIQSARKRKEKFREKELEILVAEVRKNQIHLFGPESGCTSLTARHKIWSSITSKINAVGVRHRSVSDVKRRWHDLRRRSKVKVMAGPNGMTRAPLQGTESNGGLEEAEGNGNTLPLRSIERPAMVVAAVSEELLKNSCTTSGPRILTVKDEMAINCQKIILKEEDLMIEEREPNEPNSQMVAEKPANIRETSSTPVSTKACPLDTEQASLCVQTLNSEKDQLEVCGELAGLRKEIRCLTESVTSLGEALRQATVRALGMQAELVRSTVQAGLVLGRVSDVLENLRPIAQARLEPEV